jgi:drug/metabolite transporter (DMT)-like permease
MNQLEQVILDTPEPIILTRQARIADSVRKLPPKWLGIGLVTVAGVSYGIQAILGKLSYNGGANPETLLTFRFVVAMVIIWLLIFVLARRGTPIPLRQPRKKVYGFFILGLLWIPNSLLYFMGLKLLPAGTAVLLVYVFPALVVLWATIFFHEKLGVVKALALGLALLGCFLTVDPAVAFSEGASFNWLGAILVFGSAFSNSWYSILAQRFGKGVSGLVTTAYGLPLTAACFTLYSVTTGQFTLNMELSGWLCCIAVGVLTAFSIYSLLTGIGLIGASKAAIVSTTEPAVTVFLGAVLLNEPLSLVKLVGGLLIVVAVISLSTAKRD